jgi:hypothetical protein
MVALAPLEKRNNRKEMTVVSVMVMNIIKKMFMNIARTVQVATGAAKLSTTADIICLL